jgi:hypothetical protein
MLRSIASSPAHLFEDLRIVGVVVVSEIYYAVCLRGYMGAIHRVLILKPVQSGIALIHPSWHLMSAFEVLFLQK